MSDSQRTIDHDEIRRWVEERNGRPAHVKRTGNDGDPGLLRIDFPGGDEEISRLRELFHVYRSLNTSKSIVRTELPARVAYRCGLCLSIGEEGVVDYPGLIEREQSLPAPRIVARPSRLAESALSL